MKKFKKFFFFAVCFAMGGVLGFFLGEGVGRYMAGFPTKGMAFLWLGVMLLGGLLLVYAQIAIHEAGHLVGGLLTGYRFSSYRIGSLMLLREGDRYVWRRLSIAGTAGQCLMVPPPLVDGKIPYVIYNLGGALANLAATLLFGLLWLVLQEHVWLAPLCIIGAIIGILFAFTNGIPMQAGAVDNDGRNAVMLGRDPGALRAFWVQMQINAEIAAGTRLRALPDEWFVTEGLNMENTMTASVAVFACNRLVDAHRFDEAYTAMTALIGGKNGILELHRRLLAVDVMYIAALRGDAVQFAAYATPEQRKFMRAMKNFISVIRTDYVEALLCTRDATRAEALAARFEKSAAHYPYPADVEGERELIALAREAADARN